MTIFMILLLLMLGACSNEEEQNSNVDEENEVMNEEANDDQEADSNSELEQIQGKLELDQSSGRIGDEVLLTAEDLVPNDPLQIIWVDMVGSYALEDNYSFIGTTYEPIDIEIGTGQADDDGKWSGTITIPEGFGDDHDVKIVQDDKVVAKANFFVETVFTMSPESGPIGTEITIEGEGLSWKMYGSLWHVNYDNSYTGMITGVSTKGKATAVIRAAGEIGEHTITVESGSSGSPYLNREESAINYISTQYFTFNVTDDEPEVPLAYVEDAPEAADGGIQLPDAENKDGVEISLSQETGTVGEEIIMTGSGLPENETVVFDWHTMVGNRVSAGGFNEEIWDLGEVETDENGEFTFPFEVPDDLGGLPHLIDVKVQDEIYGQTHLKILPSIASVTPSSGPVGTKFVVEIKGSGWTEFDNALAVTYDNSKIGYICGFNSQGTIKLPVVASGDPGYHLVDIYPSIYKGQQLQPNLYLNPQLTYRDDHPGTGIPALRVMFEVTEE